MKATDYLLGYPLVSSLAVFDERRRMETNKVVVGVDDFLKTVEKDFPEIQSDPEGFARATHAAKALVERMRAFMEVRQSLHGKRRTHTNVFDALEAFVDLDVEGFPEALLGGLVIPLLGALQTDAERLNMVEAEYITKHLDVVRHANTHRFLKHTDIVGDDGLGRTGKFLLRRSALGGYTQLAYSYLPYFLNLELVMQDPSVAGLGKPVGRLQPENAQASNKLISNIVGRLVEHALTDQVRTVLDFGSGGGHFLLGMAQEQLRVVGLDINKAAIGSSRALFKSSGVRGSVYHGNLTSEVDLGRIAKENKPDVAFINYILHDIAGSSPSREAGLDVVKDFLFVYRQYFAETPLYISESYLTSPEILRSDGNAGAIVFAFLHAVSPQHLLKRAELFELLEKTGFEVEDEIIHTRHKDGAPSNSTVRAVPK